MTRPPDFSAPRVVYYGMDAQPISQDEAMKLWEGEGEGRVVQQDRVDGILISTVLLMIDHNYFGEGPPLIFETMIFGGDHDGYTYRYATRAQALSGHARAVALVNSTPKWKRVRNRMWVWLRERMNRAWNNVAHWAVRLWRQVYWRIRPPRPEAVVDASHVLVNNYMVFAQWPTEDGVQYAYGEALTEAVSLACLAYPERLAKFPCGSRL